MIIGEVVYYLTSSRMSAFYVQSMSQTVVDSTRERGRERERGGEGDDDG